MADSYGHRLVLNKGSYLKAYDSLMSQSAAVMVLDEIPSEEDIDELVCAHLETLDEDDNIEVSVDIVKKAPEWMDIGEQDQVNAHMRDGGVCVLVLYITILEDGYTEEDD